MTKYYFICYMCPNGARTEYCNCTCKVVNQTLIDILNMIAETKKCDTLSVVILSLKDLTKEEYEMLNGATDGN